MSIEAPSKTPSINETPLNEPVGEQLGFDYDADDNQLQLDYSEQPTLEYDNDLSGWENIQKAREINDLEQNFNTPSSLPELPKLPEDLAAPVELPTPVSDSITIESTGTETSDDTKEEIEEQASESDIKRAEQVVAVVENLLADKPVEKTPKIKNYNQLVAAVKNKLASEKVPVTVVDEEPSPIIIQRPAKSEFASIADYDDRHDADKMARERGRSLVKEKAGRLVEFLNSDEYEGVIGEKISEAISRGKSALARRAKRMFAKFNLKARLAARKEGVEADYTDIEAPEIHEEKSTMDQIYEQIEARKAAEIKNRHNKQSAAVEKVKATPALVARIGRATKNYARGVANHAVSPVVNAHRAGVENVRRNADATA